MLLLVVAGGCAQQNTARQQEMETPDQAYARGHEAFVQELVQNTARWYVYGSAPYTGFDPASGLPEERVPADSPQEQAFARGHNDAIKQYIDSYGPPPGSFKNWEQQLFNQSGYFAKRSQTEKPQVLTLGAAALTSPDGRFRLMLERPGADAATTDPSQLRLVVISADSQRTCPPPVAGAGDSADVFFGPEGSNLAFTRWPSASRNATKLPAYAALDLFSGKWLVIQPPTAAVGTIAAAPVRRAVSN